MTLFLIWLIAIFAAALVQAWWTRVRRRGRLRQARGFPIEPRRSEL